MFSENFSHILFPLFLYLSYRFRYVFFLLIYPHPVARFSQSATLPIYSITSDTSTLPRAHLIFFHITTIYHSLPTHINATSTLTTWMLLTHLLSLSLPLSTASSVAVSAWTLVAISCERYYAIVHPLKSRRWQTLSHAYKLIALIWCGSLFCMSPIAIVSRLIPTSQGKLSINYLLFPSLPVSM